MSYIDARAFVDTLTEEYREQPKWCGRLSVMLEGPGVFEWAQRHLGGAPGHQIGEAGRLAVIQCQVSQSLDHYSQEAQVELMYPGPGTGGDDPVPNTIMAVLTLTRALLELPDFHLLSNCRMQIMAETEAVG